MIPCEYVTLCAMISCKRQPQYILVQRGLLFCFRFYYWRNTVGSEKILEALKVRYLHTYIHIPSSPSTCDE